MDRKVDFSVLISVYSSLSSEYLKASLSSIENQSLKADQVVVVQDGPIDSKIKEILSEYRKILPIEILVLKKNMGLGKALHEGLKVCKHNLVARMDADDIALPERFEKQINFLLDYPNISVVGTQAIEIDAQGKRIGFLRAPIKHEEILKLIWTAPLIHPTVVFRRDKILSVGSYNGRLKRRQDYELWMRCAKAGLQFANLEEDLLLYRVGNYGSYSKTLKQAFSQARLGIKGCFSLGLGIKAYIGVCFPVFMALIPTQLRRRLVPLKKMMDPRMGSSKKEKLLIPDQCKKLFSSA